MPSSGPGSASRPKGRRIFSRMTVNENLLMGAFTRNLAETGPDIERVFTLFPRLRERIDQLGGTLSGGEQQMLAIGRALMSRPRLLLLDEPSLGLAPILVQQIFQTIKEINEQGTTILLVEQNALQALSIAHRGYVLQTGDVVLTGPASELITNEMVRKAYLGEDSVGAARAGPRRRSRRWTPTDRWPSSTDLPGDARARPSRSRAGPAACADGRAIACGTRASRRPSATDRRSTTFSPARRRPSGSPPRPLAGRLGRADRAVPRRRPAQAVGRPVPRPDRPSSRRRRSHRRSLRPSGRTASPDCAALPGSARLARLQPRAVDRPRGPDLAQPRARRPGDRTDRPVDPGRPARAVRRRPRLLQPVDRPRAAARRRARQRLAPPAGTAAATADRGPLRRIAPDDATVLGALFGP